MQQLATMSNKIGLLDTNLNLIAIDTIHGQNHHSRAQEISQIIVYNMTAFTKNESMFVEFLRVVNLHFIEYF